MNEQRLSCLGVIAAVIVMAAITNSCASRQIGPCVVVGYDDSIRSGYSHRGVILRDKHGDTHFASMNSSAYDRWKKFVGSKWVGEPDDSLGVCR